VLSLPDHLVISLTQRGQGLNFLVIRFAALGDIVRTLPAVRMLKRALPESRIVWAVDQTWSLMLEGHPDLAGLAIFPRNRWDDLRRSPVRWPDLPGAYREWRDRLRATESGIVLDFHGNLRSGITGRLSGAPLRIGYSGHQQKEGNRWFTTHQVPAGPRRTSRIDRNLDLVRALGLPVNPLAGGGLAIPDTARAAARRAVIDTLGDERPYAVIAPGVSRRQAYKRPPARLLAAAARTLTDRHIAPVVVHGPGEETDARRVVQEASGASWMAPATDLWTLTALIEGARVFVGGDTGPLHISCAVGCPVIGVYGPTDPLVNTPWGVPFRTIHPDVAYTGVKKFDRKLGSFDDIPTSEMATTVDTFISELKATPGSDSES
jgi:ADP-heptose:LPS heptosyltransferase